MENYICLSINKEDNKKSLGRIWYNCVKNILPDGVLTTIQDGEKVAVMKKKMMNKKILYLIPLLKNITEKESDAITDRFGHLYHTDFSISSSKIEVLYKDTIDVVVEPELALELATKWAKDAHDKWYKEKVDSGWRYGAKHDKNNKTHPLIRQWNDLPEKYKSVDTKSIDEFIKFINDSGYVIVPRQELK